LRSGRLPVADDDQPDAPPSSPDGGANRAAELAEQGINREGVERILDLEMQIAQLEAENRYLAQNLGFAAATDFLQPPPRRFRWR
jgi:hypothetical protein